MSSILGLDTTKNLSFYTIPAAFVMCMVPNLYAVMLGGDKFDSANPRKFKETIEKDSTVDKVIQQRIIRGKAASENGFETLGFYAAAVVAANHAGVEASTLNTITISYILSRIGFIFTYVRLQDNRNFAALRSICWMTGIGLIFTLFIKAGNKLSAN